MIDSYFFIKITTNKTELQMGPYASFEDAAEMLFDYADPFIVSQLSHELTEYVATIEECIVEQNTIILINTKIQEHRIIKG